MSHSYTIIHADGSEEGNLDLLMMMKRIKAGKISPTTKVFVDQAEFAIPASEVEDLQLFFRSVYDETAANAHPQDTEWVLLKRWLTAGWRFLSDNPTLSVFSGSLVLVSFLMGILLVSTFSLAVGALGAVFVFWFFQTIIWVCALRLNRGQHIISGFLSEAIVGRMLPLLLGSCVIGIAATMTTALFIIPGIIFLTFYCFTAFFISDRGLDVFSAMSASRAMTLKLGSNGIGALFAIMTIYLLALFSLLLVPFVLPIVIGAVAEIYDQHASLVDQ